MTARETTLGEIGTMLGHVVQHMATKEDRLRSARPADRFRLKMAGEGVERTEEICEQDLGKNRSRSRIGGDGNDAMLRR
jgi:hypothetical protein